MKLNQRLAIVAGALLVASVWTYQASVSRSQRFERGQRFLPNLNPDDVASIMLSAGDDTVTLERGDDGFTVAEINGYPASNTAVNRVLRSLVELELEKEVGVGDELFDELGLSADADGSLEVALRDATDQDMVRLIVGNDFEGGGSYLLRIDGDGGPAFLSTRRATFSSSPDSFLDKEIVKVEGDLVERIDGPDFAITRTEDGLKLDGVPNGREETPAAMNRIKRVLGQLRFDEVFLADDARVRGLRLEPRLDLRLTDGSGYRLAVAERDGEHFLQIAGYHTVDRVTVDRDESDQQLEAKAEILERADEMARFNRFHGSWIYRISDSTADTINLRKEDLSQAKS